MLFKKLFPDHPFTVSPTLEPTLSEMNIIGMDAMFIPYQCGSVLDWLSSAISIILKLASFVVRLPVGPTSIYSVATIPGHHFCSSISTSKLELFCYRV